MTEAAIDVIALLLTKADAFENASASKRASAASLRKEADDLENTAADEAAAAFALRRAADKLGSV